MNIQPACEQMAFINLQSLCNKLVQLKEFATLHSLIKTCRSK